MNSHALEPAAMPFPLSKSHLSPGMRLAKIFDASKNGQHKVMSNGRQTCCHSRGKAMKLGERIRRARRRAGISQAQLAAAVRVRRSAVSNWESVAAVHPTMVNLAAIAQACNVSLDWLGTGRGVMAVDTLDDVQAADAELIDSPAERRLLSIFRSLPRHSQNLVLDLLELLVVRKRLAKSK